MPREATGPFRGTAVLLLVAVMAAPAVGAAGSAITSPPEDVEIDPDSGTVTWEPPSVNAEAVEEYRVYQNGDAVAATESTNATLDGVETGDVLWVTAVSAEGESAPSTPEIVGNISAGCINTAIGEMPPVWVNLDCVPDSLYLRVTLGR